MSFVDFDGELDNNQMNEAKKIEFLENQVKTLKKMLSPEIAKIFTENTDLKKDINELKTLSTQNADHVNDLIQQIMQKEERIMNLESQLTNATDSLEE